MNNCIIILTLILLAAMVLAGGKNGLKSFFGLILTLGILIISVTLIAWGISYLIVTLIGALIILATTIYFGNSTPQNAEPAFYAALIVLAIMICLIVPIEHWAQIQGFGNENTPELEGMSLQIGIKFMNVSISMMVLSTLGAIAEAAVSISSNLHEILQQNPELTTNQITISGIKSGHQILSTACNTLFFGFFGGFLSLFIWFVQLNYSFGTFLNDKIFVAEFSLTIISIIAVILTIPTTILIFNLQHHHHKLSS
ncbi:MAG: YibE/F family protein [Liquorilactobacillus nagelii]|uniref:YibE/F family protein n=1 Tax=Liquorilactobacillus nagelii TaxID=82688 RepID=UPI00242C9E9B|nr:YibE/F family protein [Liquorilactobacillus nagelii]MCI1632710.1 YibE/F family protein [Liquorilactobacillus nagelii]